MTTPNPLISSFSGTSTNYPAPNSPSSKPFMTPWLDYSTVAVPDNHELVMWWAQYLWLSDGNYRTAMERVAAHFLTTIEFPDLEENEESVWKDVFNEHLDYRAELLGCGHDFLAYGNVVVAIYVPFQRMMKCKGCGYEQPIQRVDYNLEYTTTDPYLIWKRKAPCEKCGNRDAYEVTDRRDADLSRVKLNRYSPEEIELAYNRHSQKKSIWWKMLEEDKRNYLNKARIHIDETPLEILETVARQGKFEFDEEFVLHHAEPCISGVRTHGWGLPRSISNFRTAWLNQLNNKMDQAVVIDYTLGIRMLSPTPSPGGMDPMQLHGMEQFSNRMNGIIQTHRNNPTTYHTSPYPVQYQFMGGEGSNILTPDKLKFRHQEYLNQLGVPLEYHQMNLQAQAAPLSLRMFEAYWQAIPSFYNKILNWIVEVLVHTYGLEDTQVRLQKTTIADDIERKNVLLQLMSANQLSPQTALQPFGVDAFAEIKNVARYQKAMAKQQGKDQEAEAQRQEMGFLSGMVAQPTPSMLAQQQQMAAQGGAAGGAMPPGGAGGMMPPGGPMGGIPGSGAQPTSLNQMSDQAQQVAMQLVSMDEFSRNQELRNLRESNKDLHALVKGYMEKIRSQARSQGGQMLLQQGGGAPPA